MTVFLFTDIEGSTDKWQKYPDRMPKALAYHDSAIEEAVESHRGRIVKNTGDGFFAIFEKGDPLGCALQIQRSLQFKDWGVLGDLRIRIAVHVGNAVNIGNDFFGPDVNKTSRILNSTWGGQTVFTEAVRQYCTIPPDAYYKDLGHHTLKDLGEPTRLYSLSASGLPLNDFPPLRSLSTHRHNLPGQTTPFVGREEEVAHISGLIRSGHRLVTLTGPGGIGKTRTAIQIAADLFEDFPHGVFFIPLDRLDSPSYILPAIAEALGFTFYGTRDEKTQLEGYLGHKKILLLFDNFEHVIEGAVSVTSLLEKVPSMVALVTSREALCVRGEYLLNLDGLDVPESGAEHLGLSSAMQLFIYNSQRVNPRRELSMEDRENLAEICRLLQGQPLGIELAASWCNILDCGEILREIHKNIDFLTSRLRDIPERHRSLRAVFDYSWALLEEEEREAFERLAAFRGGFDRTGAERVAGAGTLMLAGLVDKSLIRATSEGRYEMLYVLREYALRKLEEDENTSRSARQKHCELFRDFLEERVPRTRSFDCNQALSEISLEMENIKSALEWAVTNGRDDIVASMAAGIHLFCIRRGWLRLGITLFEQTAQALSETADEILLSRLRRSAAVFRRSVGQFKEARKVFLECLEVFRSRGLTDDIVQTMLFLGETESLLGNHAEAETLLKECLELSQGIEDRYLLTDALLAMGSLHDRMGQYRKDKDRAEEALKLSEELGYPYGIAKSYSLRAGAELGLGMYEDAVRDFGKALELNRQFGHREAEASILNNIAITYSMTGDDDLASEYFGKSLKMRKEMGDKKGVTEALGNLAIGAMNRGENEIAVALFEEALDICREIGYRTGTCSHLTNLGLIFFNTGDTDRAVVMLTEAHEIAESIGDNWLMEHALIHLGSCHRVKGDLKVSKDFIREGLLMAHQNGHVPMVMVALVEACEILVIEETHSFAFELLTFARQYRATPSALYPIIDPLLEKLDKVIDTSLKASLINKTADRDLESTVIELLTYLGS